MGTSTKAVRYFFASPPKNLDNDQPYVLVGFPILTGIATGAAVFVGSMYGLWTMAGHTGVLGGVDNMPLSEHASIWGKGAIDLLLRHKQPYAALVNEYMYELSLSSWWLIKGKALLSAVPSFLTMRWVTRKLCKRQVFEEQVGGMELVTGPKAHEEAVKAVDKLNGRTETDRHRWWRERGLRLGDRRGPPLRSGRGPARRALGARGRRQSHLAPGRAARVQRDRAFADQRVHRGEEAAR
ncbi:hypothetical protein [Burkholderia pseudomallei]|uniref:hypothetical protein n=1 Tax=Burkholderia pseudomallei TaxID=28450 RepID=UPI000F4EC131|nr:hypothetical protein [Burkholderia pseudomallei]